MANAGKDYHKEGVYNTLLWDAEDLADALVAGDVAHPGRRLPDVEEVTGVVVPHWSPLALRMRQSRAMTRRLLIRWVASSSPGIVTVDLMVSW